MKVKGKIYLRSYVLFAPVFCSELVPLGEIMVGFSVMSQQMLMISAVFSAELVSRRSDGEET